MRDFHLPGRSPVLAANGMAATSHPIAARAAVAMLEAGGNAVDAAIAGAVLLGIAEPQATGIGGDMFVLIKPPGEERVLALNASGRAPAAASAEALRAKGLAEVPTEGALPVTLPGAIDGFCRLSADWGRAGLAASLAPAIRYAEEGIPVAHRVAFDWQVWGNRLSGAARQHFLIGGQIPGAGRKFRAPGQAEVLRRIARQGRAGFYEGVVAADMLASLNALGGVHTEADFAAVASEYTEPLSGAYHGHELIEHRPNGQGATAILMLNILSHFDLAALPPNGARRAHLEAEAAKLAYDARDRFIADPDRTTRLDHMLAPETAARLAALIDPAKAMDKPGKKAGAVHRETVYITVVDRDRMAVSLIYSVFWPFGAGIASDRFGILFQNRGAGFVLEKGHPNELTGGARPMHTIIPGMIRRDGRVWMPFGIMGGGFQPAGHSRIVNNVALYGMNPQEAIDAPRAFPEDGVLKVERGYPETVRAELAAMGHKVEVPEGPLGGGQAIAIDAEAGVLIGGSDPRKDGCALGY